MGLKDLELKHSYRSSSENIHLSFYNKCLKEATKYDRATGYFSSSSFQVIAEGLEEFLYNDGKIRMIVNPHLSLKDVEAIERGVKAKRKIVEDALLREFKPDKENLVEDSLNTLAWLVYEDVLEIKVAFTKKFSLYHEKFGIFYDREGDKVAFIGSSNETLGGLKTNFEKIEVFSKENDFYRIESMISDFSNLWNNHIDGLDVIDFPEKAYEELKKYKSKKPTLNNNKSITPRGYQKNAISSFIKNNWKGILEMATGTGKTFTSLFIADNYYKINKRIFLVIIVPFTHLVDQWIEACQEFGFKNFTKCSGLKKKWKPKLQADIRDFRLRLLDKNVVITTYNTASSDEFYKFISNIEEDGFLIADECHYFGIPSMRQNHFTSIKTRLGLSATPNRWWDDEGSTFVNNYFGGVVFEYGLEEAIKNGFLTEYSYNTEVIDLTRDEIEQYQSYSSRIIYEYSKDTVDHEKIKNLSIQRSLIISRAKNKLLRLIEILRDKDLNTASHILVYCAPGDIDITTRAIANLGYKVHKFNSEVKNAERIKILEAFDKEKIQILVAIKCLDEGVDVPSTKEAFFLASTSNPKEFIQRRGRILRTHENKTFSYITDFVVLPQFADVKLFENIARKELPRVAEFSTSAMNTYSSRAEIVKILSDYGISYLVEKKPWEVYKEQKMKEE